MVRAYSGEETVFPVTVHSLLKAKKKLNTAKVLVADAKTFLIVA